MSEKPTIREQIDACRAGSEDLSSPELGPLAREIERHPAVAQELRRSQRFDGLMIDALNDVQIPAGLAERILAASETSGAAAEVSLPPADGAAGRGQRWPNRRTWLLVAGSVSLASLLMFCLYALAWRPLRVVNQGELAADVGTLILGLDGQSWLPCNGGRSPNGLTMDPAILGTPQQCQPVRLPQSAIWSGSVTAIDLARPGRPRAILFIVRSSTRFSVPSVPTTTALLPLTGGYKATAWQRPNSKVLYILVIEERGQRLDDFLRKTPEA